MSTGLTTRIATEESDWALVAAAKNGEDDAFEILVRRYQTTILCVAFRITRNREDAQDVVQQSLQNAFVHLQHFQEKSSFSTWLTRIAINEALMCLRKNRRLRAVPLDETGSEPGDPVFVEIPDASASPEAAYMKREEEQILSFVINKLPPTLQTAFHLYLDDLTVKEIAGRLGVGRPAVKARLFRGRNKAIEIFKCCLEPIRNHAHSNIDNAA
jgi:RNA polymerase sigma-70 factor (ECF subfamily)